MNFKKSTRLLPAGPRRIASGKKDGCLLGEVEGGRKYWPANNSDWTLWLWSTRRGRKKHGVCSATRHPGQALGLLSPGPASWAQLPGSHLHSVALRTHWASCAHAYGTQACARCCVDTVMLYLPTCWIGGTIIPIYRGGNGLSCERWAKPDEVLP